jgi:hypothetical protein
MMAMNVRVIEEPDAAKLRGAIHVLNRTFPLLLEDKDMFIECMWREKPFFNSQINAISMMEAISVLNFKEGFTIEQVPGGKQPDVFGIDEYYVWRNGISVPAAMNHESMQFNKNRASLLRLMITTLSQPLYFSADDYLQVLNPFSTYFSNRRSKNCKNLFISLLNTILSYDCAGYGLPYFSAVD